MHIHANQLNLNADLYAALAAAKAEAKKSAEQTRKKLITFASALAGEVDDPVSCVVKLSGKGEPRDQPKQQDGQDEADQNEEIEQADPEGFPFSGWA